MTHLKRILAQYVPQDKINMVSIEILDAVLKDCEEPENLKIRGLEGKEHLIEMHEKRND